jgi:hypothetical protein
LLFEATKNKAVLVVTNKSDVPKNVLDKALFLEAAHRVLREIQKMGNEARQYNSLP